VHKQTDTCKRIKAAVHLGQNNIVHNWPQMDNLHKPELHTLIPHMLVLRIAGLQYIA
jgi:hypothetical protein